MDKTFKQSAISHKYRLHAVDMITGFTNIPFIFYYENVEQDRSFMPSTQIRESFYLALTEFPILAGNLVRDSSGSAIVVDKANLNMPEFLESDYDIDFSDLKCAQFSWDLLPDGFITIDAVPRPGSNDMLKLVNVHLARLRENSGVVLFISIVHYPVDGIGYCAFVNRWACICQQMQKNSLAQPPSSLFEFDRHIIENSLPTTRNALDDMTYNLYARDSFSAQLLARLSPEKRGTILSKLSRLEEIKGHVFHLATESLKALHAVVRRETDAAIRISDNDIITALVSMVLAQGTSSADMTYDGTLSKIFRCVRSMVNTVSGLITTKTANTWLTSVVVDSRTRLKHIGSTNYTGNAVLAAFFSTDLEQMQARITDQSLALAAQQVRHTVSRMDGPSIAGIVDIIKHSHQSYARALANTLPIKNKVVVSNQSRFDLYSADFGSGCPTWISPTPSFYANFVSLLPRSSEADGYYIYISTTAAAMKHILKNESWTKWARFVY